MTRELVVLGTSSAVPTRTRNHNGYLLRWDGLGVLFDPGEGTQRQLLLAGLGSSDVDWLCVTHLHGDHCLGVPGILQRIARDGGDRTIDAAFPASGAVYWERLRHATPFYGGVSLREHPLGGEAAELPAAGVELTARRLDHGLEAYGFRLAEPAGVTMRPERLAAHGISGPLVGRLQREGVVTAPSGRRVTLADCSVPRPGQAMAFVMDTRPCDAAVELAAGADLLVIESTYLDEAETAWSRYHMTAGQAGKIAAEAGVRRLVLTHLSERYTSDDEPRFLEAAAAAFDGEVVLAHDLMTVAVPPRLRTP